MAVYPALFGAHMHHHDRKCTHMHAVDYPWSFWIGFSVENAFLELLSMQEGEKSYFLKKTWNRESSQEQRQGKRGGDYFRGFRSFCENTIFHLPALITILKKHLPHWNPFKQIKGNPVHACECIFDHDDACEHQKMG